MASQDPRSSGGFVRTLVAITASLSLIGALGAAAFAAQWYSLRGVGVGGTLHPTQASGTSGGTGPQTGPCTRRPCNYLLLGSDSRAGLSAEQQTHFGNNQDIGGTSRADTIMVVHTDPDLQKAIVLSFPRDLWVDIPGHGMDKINAAFEGGVDGNGPQLMADTVTKLTGLPIDHYLYVDLNGFQKVVETLGGVEMCIPSYNVNTPGYVEGSDADGNPTQIYYGESGHIVDPNTGLDVVPGCQTLDGFQALAYVRSRHLPCDLIPDFSRIGRQQQFMRSLINQLLQPAELTRAIGLVRPVLASLKRDKEFLPGDLVYLVGQMRGLSTGAVEFRAIPGTAAMEGTQSVVLMDPSARAIFQAVRDGKSISGVGTELVNTPPSEANTEVVVFDDGNPTGAAAVEDILVRAGFDVSPGVVTGNGPNGVTGAAIAYRPDALDQARVVATYFPDLKLVEVKHLQAAPVAIVVPPGYTPTEPGTGGATPPPAASECPTPTA